MSSVESGEKCSEFLGAHEVRRSCALSATAVLVQLKVQDKRGAQNTPKSAQKGVQLEMQFSQNIHPVSGYQKTTTTNWIFLTFNTALHKNIQIKTKQWWMQTKKGIIRRKKTRKRGVVVQHINLAYRFNITI